MYLAVAGLFGIVIVVVGSVFMRYIMNDAPSWTEQVALIMVICVAMFGASAGVRDEGHIGMESLVGLRTDKVNEVTTLSRRASEPPPRIGMKWPPEFIERLIKRDGEFIILPNLRAIFASTRRAD